MAETLGDDLGINSIFQKVRCMGMAKGMEVWPGEFPALEQITVS
jgi:hypothetical protein